MARVPLRGTGGWQPVYPQSALRLDWGYSLVYLFEAPRAYPQPFPKGKGVTKSFPLGEDLGEAPFSLPFRGGLG